MTHENEEITIMKEELAILKDRVRMHITRTLRVALMFATITMGGVFIGLVFCMIGQILGAHFLTGVWPFVGGIVVAFYIVMSNQV